MQISKVKIHHSLSNFPPAWSCAWGEDKYGIFADLMIDEEKKITQRFRYIATGEFMMGSPSDEPDRYADEDYHKVSLSRGYWLADSCVTQQVWLAVMGKNRSRFKESNQNPVENVSWNDAQSFIKKLNNALLGSLEKGMTLRLPTEAEWEHACRAGTETPFSFGENITVDEVNYNGKHPYVDGKQGQYREKTVAVKSLTANPWGLYEMHGNLWEWCADAWKEQLGEQPVIDPYHDENSADNAHRVVRGGSWLSNGGFVRSAYRSPDSPGLRGSSTGFRLSLGPELQLRSKKKK